MSYRNTIFRFLSKSMILFTEHVKHVAMQRVRCTRNRIFPRFFLFLTTLVPLRPKKPFSVKNPQSRTRHAHFIFGLRTADRTRFFFFTPSSLQYQRPVRVCVLDSGRSFRLRPGINYVSRVFSVETQIIEIHLDRDKKKNNIALKPSGG